MHRQQEQYLFIYETKNIDGGVLSAIGAIVLVSLCISRFEGHKINHVDFTHDGRSRFSPARISRQSILALPLNIAILLSNDYSVTVIMRSTCSSRCSRSLLFILSVRERNGYVVSE